MKTIIQVSLLVLLTSCENYHIEEDAEKFCSCRRMNTEEPTKCNQLLDSISKEYQFDPESTEYLSLKIEECMPK